MFLTNDPLLSDMEVVQHGFSWDSDRFDNLKRRPVGWSEKSEVPLGRELMLSEERENKSYVH